MIHSATYAGSLAVGDRGAAKVGKDDNRAHMPRFSGEAGERNAAAVARFHAFAAERGMTPAQLSVAWVLAKQPGFVPVVGARTREQLQDVRVALERPLFPADVAAVEALLPTDAIEGPRYRGVHMKQLDSER